MWFRHRQEDEPSIFDLAKNPLIPIPFFRFKFPLYSTEGFPLTEKHLLQDLTSMNGSHFHLPFYIAWSKEGLFFQIHYPKQEFVCHPTQIKQGDAIELFIDTRDNKEGNFPTQFCHHFLFFPEQVEGIFGKEITRFRGDHTHDLAQSKDLLVQKKSLAKKNNKGTQLEIFIPRESLHGYDPDQLNRIGFTYRCHIEGLEPQLFSTSPQFSIEQNPSFFASFELK